MSRTLSVDVWSDIACPWCYVGKRHLEQALARFPHAASVKVRWRAFELDPSAPKAQGDGPYAERLAKKYRTSLDQAQGMIDRMVSVAKKDGIEMRFDRIRPGNTFDAHRLVHLGAERGKQDAVKERFLRGYFTEGAAISEHDTLARLAVEAGLDEDEVRAILGTNAYADEVREDEEEAHAHGISGVPFFALASRYGVSGAQPAELLLAALEKAWSELPKLEAVAEGPACGPEGCA